MTDKTPSRPADEKSLADAMRVWGDTLSLWRLCQSAACVRARGCRGDARVCFPRNIHLLPEGVQAWFHGIGKAQEDNLTFEEAIEWLDTTDAGEAFHEWKDAVKRSLGETVHEFGARPRE